MSKKPLIISTDPGIDDIAAMTISLFADELDVKMIVPFCFFRHAAPLQERENIPSLRFVKTMDFTIYLLIRYVNK